MQRTMLSCGGVLVAAMCLGFQPASELDPSRPAWARSFGGESSFTEPAMAAMMGFDQPTSITEVLIKGGEKVSEGDLLIRGDDTDELALYRIQEIQVADNLDVQRLSKIRDLREVQYEMTKESFDQGAGSQLELDERRVTMEVAGVELKVGEMEFEQSKLTLDRYKARVDRLRVYAPFDGIVEIVHVDLGQSVGEEDPVLRLVNTDTLHLDVHTDTDETLRLGLKPGDDAWVLIDVPGERRVYQGSITEVSPVAYYATQQRRIRVEIPNQDGWPAGLPAYVRFTEPEGEWADRIVQRSELLNDMEPVAVDGARANGF